MLLINGSWNYIDTFSSNPFELLTADYLTIDEIVDEEVEFDPYKKSLHSYIGISVKEKKSIELRCWDIIVSYFVLPTLIEYYYNNLGESLFSIIEKYFLQSFEDLKEIKKNELNNEDKLIFLLVSKGLDSIVEKFHNHILLWQDFDMMFYNENYEEFKNFYQDYNMIYYELYHEAFLVFWENIGTLIPLWFDWKYEEMRIFMLKKIKPSLVSSKIPYNLLKKIKNPKVKDFTIGKDLFDNFEKLKKYLPKKI